MPRPLLLLLAVLAGSAHGQVTELFEPSKDNTLYESTSGNLSNGSGSFLFVGRTQNRELRRAVMAFDLSSIPSGSTVESVSLQVTVNRTIAGPVQTRVHALSADWGEGSSNAGGQEGGGGAAADGDATWIHRFSPDQQWNQRGGDFGPAIATFTLAGSGNHTLASSDPLVAVVQSWVDNPDDNFGIILIAEDDAGTTAKRLGARETNSGPRLEVTYTEGGQATPGIAGLWFDPALPGDGYNVIQSAEGLTIFFFGYLPSGERLWLVTDTSTATVSFGEPITIQVFVGSGGTFDDPASATLAAWGSLTVTFIDETTAQFDLVGDDGTKLSQTTKLQGVSGNTESDPATKGSAPGFAGLWFNPEAPGDGYNVIQSAEGLTVFFFGYLPDGQRLWLATDTSTDAVAFDTPITITVFVGDGGSFDDPSTASLSEWGTLTVTFLGCSSAQFDLMGNDGTKISRQTKLQGVSGNICDG